MVSNTGFAMVHFPGKNSLKIYAISVGCGSNNLVSFFRIMSRNRTDEPLLYSRTGRQRKPWPALSPVPSDIAHHFKKVIGKPAAHSIILAGTYQSP